jgi:thiol-disulfide isomerase/thioredoxin
LDRLQRALAIALVVGVGLAAGFISYRLQSGRAAPPAKLAVNGADAGAGAGAGAIDTESAALAAPQPVPELVPDLTLPDPDGFPKALRSFAGRPLIINFWATWCAPCRREIPLLRELRQRHQAEHLEVVGIALDFAAAVRQYLQQMPIDYPLLIGEQGGYGAAEQFGVQAVLPFSVFVDAESRIVAVKIGELHREEAEFILSEIGALDRGEAGMAQVRGAIEARLKELAIERAKAQQKSG